MCQYSEINGVMTDWHTQHLMQLGFSAAGLIMVESTAVEKIGRITHNCVGIYDNKCKVSFKKKSSISTCWWNITNVIFFCQLECQQAILNVLEKD